MSSITDSEQRAALANLYADAAARVNGLWRLGRLEKRSARLHSSQALCVSVLETIASRPPEQVHALMQAITNEAGLSAPVASPVDIAAEVREHRDVLGETGAGTPTSLDGLAHWPGGVLTIESKFSEPEFGACGQIQKKLVKPPDPRAEGAPSGLPVANCSGVHAVGSDTKPSTANQHATCRLTITDGRRGPRSYWTVAPNLFKSQILTIPQACPFASDNYQLMRNLAFAHEWPSRTAEQWFGTLICLVDRSPHSPELRSRVARFKGILRPEIGDRVGVISYERIADVLESHSEARLAAWVRQRIADVAIIRHWQPSQRAESFEPV